MLKILKNWFESIVYKVGISKAKKKSPILKEVFENPDNLKLEASIEGSEIVIKIKMKEEL